MSSYPVIRRYWWIFAFVAGAILFSIALSAEFRWSTISEDWRAFLKEWAIDWVPALATFVVAVGVLQQVLVIRRGQRTEYAPVLRLDLELLANGPRPHSNPLKGYYSDPFEDEELDWHREAGAEPIYLMLTIQNLQKHSAGSASEVEIEVSLWLPIEPFSFRFPLVHIEPGAKETHAIINLGGLNWSAAEIVSIDFDDDSGDHYTRAHGLAVLERDRDGNVEPGYTVIG